MPSLVPESGDDDDVDDDERRQNWRGGVTKLTSLLNRSASQARPNKKHAPRTAIATCFYLVGLDPVLQP